MYNEILSNEYLKRFDYEETKRNVENYFLILEDLKWEWKKLNAQRGLVVDFENTVEFQKQSYSPLGKDIFGISAREYKEEELRKHLASYYLAKSILTYPEQLYIEECFLNHKTEDEIVSLLEIGSKDSRIFRNLKSSAIYKFADFLGLVENKREIYIDFESIEKVGKKR